MSEQAEKASDESLMYGLLDHYNALADRAHCYSNTIPKAIEFYFEYKDVIATIDGTLIETGEIEMENQHKKISGYRDLSQEEIDLMNQCKEQAQFVGDLIEEMRSLDKLDQRWVSIAQTDLQKGFMALVRSIAQPTTF